MRKFIILLMMALLISGCRLFDENSQTETVTIILPEWAPDATTRTPYPPLSRWKITLATCEGTRTFFTTDSEVKVNTLKNCPLSLQAVPITLLENGSECLYFHPAGCIYPAETVATTSATLSASWEQGYIAFIMQKLYENCELNGASPSQAACFISTFNWQKACALVKSKLEESSGSRFYNPWLCDTPKILNNLSNETFRASLLSPSSCYSFSTDELYRRSGLHILSPFIPENSNIEHSHQITLKKDNSILLSDAKETGIFTTYKSEKNVLIGYIYIPIFKGEL